MRVHAHETAEGRMPGRATCIEGESEHRSGGSEGAGASIETDDERTNERTKR